MGNERCRFIGEMAKLNPEFLKLGSPNDESRMFFLLNKPNAHQNAVGNVFGSIPTNDLFRFYWWKSAAGG